jgi:hypothetical protein
VSIITLGATGGAERVAAGVSLLAVIVRSVLVGVNTTSAPIIKVTKATAMTELQPEPVSSKGSWVVSLTIRR